jgi:hypothetical protein
MILINSIVGVDVCDDVEIRVHLRNQMHACGLSRIIDVKIISLFNLLLLL